MALSAAKTWVAGEVLTAADLNTLNTNILNNALSLISPLTGNLDVDGQDLLDADELEFRDAAANPTATRRLRLNGSTLWWLIEDARTNTVTRPLGIRATTTGAPAASIGVGLSFDGESADEAPSNFGALDFVATDVTAGSEDTALDVLLRTAGGALGARYRFASTGAFRLTFTGAPTANRTITIPDSSFTIPTSGAESGTWTDVTASRALATVYQNTSGVKRRLSICVDHQDADNRMNLEVGSANPPTLLVSRVGPAGVIGAASRSTSYTEVPNNWYYRMAHGSGTGTLISWFELDE